MESEIQSLSNIILEALRSRDFTVEKLGQLTGISENHLEAILEERFDKLPAQPYIGGYIIKIADVLDLNGKELWDQYLKDLQVIRRSGSEDQLPQNRFTSRIRFNKRSFLAIIIIVILIGYGLIRTTYTLRKPGFDLINLHENFLTVQEPTFKIIGTIQSNVKLTMNGETIYADANGNFEETIQLNLGVNILEFKSKRFLGQEQTIIKQLVYQEPLDQEPLDNQEALIDNAN